MVSVIIPNYNHSKYLEQRIDSVIYQSYVDFEIILLDDASTDSSKLIIEKYRSHPKVSHIVYNETNSGSTFKQWIKGFSLAKGTYLWIAESDDYCTHDFLEKSMSVFNQMPEVGLLYSGTTSINTDGDVLWTSAASGNLDVWIGTEFIEQKMIFGNAIFNASMAIFKRDLITPPFNNIETFQFCGDWLFWILIARNTKVARVPYFLNFFRNHELDVSGKSYKNGLYFIEYKKMLSDLLRIQIIQNKVYKKALFTMLQKVEDFDIENSIKEEIRQSYHSEFSFMDSILFKLDQMFFNRVRHKIKLLNFK